MAIIAPTFDFMKVSPANDALLYTGLSSGDRIIKGYGAEFRPTASGLSVTIEPGAAIVQGRLIYTDTNTTISIPANTTGYITATIDLSKVNTFSGVPGEDNYKPVNNQARLEFVRSLVQQDVHTSGKIYNMPIASIKSTGSAVTVTRNIPDISTPTYLNGFKDYSAGQAVVIYREGNICHMTGAVTNSTTIAAGAATQIGRIPAELAPASRNASALQQGSGNTIYFLGVTPAGIIEMSRARSGANAVAFGAGTWMLVDISWSVR